MSRFHRSPGHGEYGEIIGAHTEHIFEGSSIVRGSLLDARGCIDPLEDPSLTVDYMFSKRRQNAVAEQSAAMHAEGDMPMRSKGHGYGGAILPRFIFFPGTPEFSPGSDSWDEPKIPGMVGVISPDDRIYEWVQQPGATEGTEK